MLRNKWGEREETQEAFAPSSCDEIENFCGKRERETFEILFRAAAATANARRRRIFSHISPPLSEWGGKLDTFVLSRDPEVEKYRRGCRRRRRRRRMGKGASAYFPQSKEKCHPPPVINKQVVFFFAHVVSRGLRSHVDRERGTVLK